MVLSELNNWDPVGLNPIQEQALFKEYETYSNRIAGFLWNNREAIGDIDEKLKVFIAGVFSEAFDVTNLDSDSLNLFCQTVKARAKQIFA